MVDDTLYSGNVTSRHCKSTWGIQPGRFHDDSDILSEMGKELEWTNLLISKSILTPGKAPIQGISCLGRLTSTFRREDFA